MTDLKSIEELCGPITENGLVAKRIKLYQPYVYGSGEYFMPLFKEFLPAKPPGLGWHGLNHKGDHVEWRPSPDEPAGKVWARFGDEEKKTKRKLYRWTLEDERGHVFDTYRYYETMSELFQCESVPNLRILRRIDESLIEVD